MIVTAAIKHQGVVFTGVRHCDIFKQILRIYPNTETPIKSSTSPQGFVNHRNEFMNRKDALAHCVECGQIETNYKGKPDIIGGVLTSEDLW